MANTYGKQMNLLRNNVPQQLPVSADVYGRVRCFNETVTYAGQASGDTIEVGKLPKGARYLFSVMTTGVTTNTATLALGNNAGAPAKYRAAATFTTVDTPTMVGQAANNGDALTAEEILILTVGTAALPGAGTLRLQHFYLID